jgi:pimeloyl-ACP methyl ester carboxylesterase
LLIPGQQDGVVLESHALSLAKKGGPQVVYWPIENAGHCDGYEVAPEAYEARVGAFLAAFKSAD